MTAKRGNWEGCLQYAVSSDVGMRRENNQDSFATILAKNYESWLDRGDALLLMVADGMGAHAAGELASKLAVDGVPHLYQKYSHLSAPEALRKALQEANAEVHRRGQANIDFNCMGTTVSVLLLLPQGALIAHIGDSRIYRLRRGVLEQWTFDHSLVWEMRAAGQLPRDAELARAIPKNVITRSLGPYPEVDVDIEGPLPLEQDDVFLLCTDGLTGRVADEEIANILAHLDPPRAVGFLVDLANLRGGPDNITVVVAKVVNDRMATAAVGPNPLVMGRGEPKPAPFPVAWVATSVLGLAALLFLIIDQWWLTGLLALAAVSSAGWAISAPFRRQSQGILLHSGRKLGRGPYATVTSLADASFAASLSDILRELRETARANGWNDSPQELEQACDEARRAQTEGDTAGAIRQYVQVARDLMGRLRIFQERRTDTAHPGA